MWYLGAWAWLQANYHLVLAALGILFFVDANKVIKDVVEAILELLRQAMQASWNEADTYMFLKGAYEGLPLRCKQALHWYCFLSGTTVDDLLHALAEWWITNAEFAMLIVPPPTELPDEGQGKPCKPGVEDYGEQWRKK